MTSFRFIHAADLHLGSPFRGLAIRDAQIAARFADATRQAFSNLVNLALAEAVDFLVIAGDIYDGEWKDSAIGLFFNRELARLDRAGIAVFVLSGNHDAESIITRSITLPDSVGRFETRRPSSFRLEHLKVALHGQGFLDRAANDNLALAYPPPVPGWFNIGVLHTSLNGRPPHANYAPCSVEDLRARGYDYWALGHVHAHEIVATDPAIVYPGNLQGRSSRETGAKGAVLVGVRDGRIETMTPIVADAARWAVVSVPIDGLETQAAVIAAVEAAIAEGAGDAEGRLLALRVRLTGTTPLRAWLMAHRSALADEVQAACHRVHPDAWLEKLQLRLSPEPAAPGAAVAAAGLDLASLLEGVEADPGFMDQAEAALAEISARLPAGLGAGEAALGEGLETLLDEARAVLQQRIAGEE